MGFKRTCVEYIKVKNNKQIESACVCVCRWGGGWLYLSKHLTSKKKIGLKKKAGYGYV